MISLRRLEGELTAMSPDAAPLSEDKESQVDLEQFTWVEDVIRDLYEVLRRLERLERLIFRTTGRALSA